MIKLFSTTILLFITLICYTQININLPISDEEIKFSKISPIISVYVTRENTLLLENDTIRLSQLARQIAYTKHKLGDSLLYLQLHLFADKCVSYSFIDDIKSELASINVKHIYHQTDAINDITKGVIWRNYASFYNLSIIEKHTKHQRQKNKRLNDSSRKINCLQGNFSSITPDPPPMVWWETLTEKIYSNKKEVVYELLNDKTFSCVTLNNEGSIFNNRHIKDTNEKELNNLLLKHDVVFLKFDPNLNYDNYISSIKTLKKLTNRNIDDKKVTAFILELSSEILKIHQKENIQICNYK